MRNRIGREAGRDMIRNAWTWILDVNRDDVTARCSVLLPDLDAYLTMEELLGEQKKSNKVIVTSRTPPRQAVLGVSTGQLPCLNT